MSNVESDRATRGFVYVAWGQKFIDEAILSAKSVKAHMNYPIALITPDAVLGENPFDEIINVPFSGTYRDKIHMRLSPFAHTIFLDTDTYVLNPMDECFDLLARFDVVYQASAPSDHYSIPGMPMRAFQEPTAGIIAWKKSARVDRFFAEWDAEYTTQEKQNGSGAWDQRSLRAALWSTDVQTSTLGRDWQLYSFEPGICMNRVKMVHGRGREARRAIEQCNKIIGPRVYIPGVGFLGAGNVNPMQYLVFGILIFKMFAKRSVRVALHICGLWRLPENKRPM